MTKFCQNFQPQKRSEKSKKFRSFCKPASVVFLIIFLISTVFIYLFEVNYISAQAVSMRDLEKEIAEIKDENQKMQVRLVEMKSMNELSTKIADLGMVQVDKINYFESSGKVVAQR